MQRPVSSVQSETAYSMLVLWKKIYSTLAASWGNKQEQAKQKMMQILFNMFEFSFVKLVWPSSPSLVRPIKVCLIISE